jgi:hypothetical protein
VEALNVVVPGLFGYRSDTPNGGNYWGAMGRAPAWDRYFASGAQGPPPTGFLRYSGGGCYAGMMVVLVACWAAAQSWRRKNSAFELALRKWLWFSLLLAFGRYAPFYHWFYALPYVSTIRNPTKFLYFFSFALIVLFAFGVDGLGRRYMPGGGARFSDRWAGLESWWRQAARFERGWLYGCGVVLIASLLAWMEYAFHRQELEEYLTAVRVSGSAEEVANFSIHQAGWFPLGFFLAAGFLALIFSGAFAGKRAATGGVLLALFLLADLGVANQPWIVFWNYQEKYASNSILDLVRDKPYEHRVVLVPLNLPSELMPLRQLYRQEWLQHQFPFFNIQSFDVVELPRMPEDFAAFKKMLDPTDKTNSVRHLIRGWQLTNTRYLLAPAYYGTLWNEAGSLGQPPLRVVARFGIVPKPGIAVATKTE